MLSNLYSFLVWLTVRHVAALLLVLAPAVAFAAGDDVTGRRAALVIGNSNYANLQKLPNAVNDAEQIGKVLRNANFEVTVGEDLTKEGLEKSIREFLQTLNDGDVALFYYSGHAVQVAGENFIIPVDANLTSSYDLEVESYNVNSLLDYMQASSALQILVLDACRDNPFRNQNYYLGDKKVDVKDAKGLASLTPRRGSLIVYSTAPNAVAYDGAGSISPFAGAFAENVLTPNEEIRQVLTKIRSQVIDTTSGRQVPWDVSSLTSQFYFVSRQNLLILGESLTEVRASPDQRRIELGIQPPIASGASALTASFDKAPKSGMLLLDDVMVPPGKAIEANRIRDVVYVTDPGPKPVELIPYTIRSDAGQVASGAVAIVFDPTAEPETDTKVASVEQEEEGVAKTVDPLRVSLSSDIGTGFTPIPALELGGEQNEGWLRVESRAPSAQVEVNGYVLMLGDLVKTEDLAKVRVRPSLRDSTEEAEIVFQPAGPVPAEKPVVIAVSAETNECDTLAAEPLDIQGVTDGVFPNDIKIDEALAACAKAVSDFPNVARFKHQYGRVLYAKGDFDASLQMLREAQKGGHVRSGQFLGRLYQLGAAVPRDPAKAIPLFEQAARRGDPYGQYSLGKALIEGNGVKADIKRGIELLNKAVESGHTYALNQLGAEYLYGRRVEKDVERAHVMFEKSAGRGDVWGEVNLGLMYRDGVFVQKDTERAFKLFEEANNKLHPYAATLMGLMERNEGKATAAELLALFRESASRGDGRGAYFAADILSTDPSLAADDSEMLRLYALAVAQKVGKTGDDARKKLAAMPADQVAMQAQKVLIRLGASGIKLDGKLGPKVRAAATELLGKPAPPEPIDLFAELVRFEWIQSTPRLDML